MIIKRRFEIIGKLIERDPKTKEIFYEEMGKHISDKKQIEEILQVDYHIFLYAADLGSGLKGYTEICKRLEELDEIEPYDNGLKYTDVTRVSLLPSREGKAAVLAMLIDNADIKRIVQIIAVEYENDRTKIIRPWSIDNVIL